MNTIPRITVLIPTYEHDKLLPFSVRSVLKQTVTDFEIFIVGDGMTSETREEAYTLARLDNRITVVEYPKSARTGEAHRDRILRERARGEYVAYVADDDLLLPRHFELMIRELATCDFVHSLPTFVNEQGVLGVSEGDLAIDFVRQRMINSSSHNFVGLTGVMHTMEMYRRLPFGWRETPIGIPTDLYMWQQFLTHPECRVRTSAYVSTLIFPSPGRSTWSSRQRLEELVGWEERLSRDDGEEYLTEMAMAYLRWSRTWLSYEVSELRIAAAVKG